MFCDGLTSYKIIGYITRTLNDYPIGTLEIICMAPVAPMK